MPKYFHHHRFGAMASVVTGLMIVSGCRSASVNSAPAYNSNSGVINSPPTYQPYDRVPRSYDDRPSPSSPQPVPPSVLPVPGYSEPEVPPPPSAQKSKWKRLPSAFKLPSRSRQADQVDQTAAKFEDHRSSEKVARNRSKGPTLREPQDDMKEEILRPRSSTSIGAGTLAPPTSMDSDVETSSSNSISETGDSSTDRTPIVLPQLKTPIKTRYGMIQQWPLVQRRSPAETMNSDVSESVSSPNNEQLDSPASSSEAPLLLPPTL